MAPLLARVTFSAISSWLNTKGKCHARIVANGALLSFPSGSPPERIMGEFSHSGEDKSMRRKRQAASVASVASLASGLGEVSGSVLLPGIMGAPISGISFQNKRPDLSGL
jgi:hypothetical protein